MLPLSSFVESSLFNINDPPTLLSTISTLDIAPHSESTQLLISNEILTLPHISDIPLTPINNTYYPILLPELKTKLNTNQFPLADDHVNIEISSPLLTNDSHPTIVTTIPLLNNDQPYVKLNNYPLQPDDTSTLIVTDPSFSLSQASISTITDPPTLDEATSDLIIA